MTDEMQTISAIIAEMRPVVRKDGGDLELVSVEGDWIRVRLSGACTHCAMAGSTLGTLRRRLIQALGRPVRVAPAAA